MNDKDKAEIGLKALSVVGIGTFTASLYLTFLGQLDLAIISGLLFSFTWPLAMIAAAALYLKKKKDQLAQNPMSQVSSMMESMQSQMQKSSKKQDGEGDK